MADENKSKDVLVHADHVKVYFKGKNKKAGAVKAVDDVSFDIMRGETFGVVGESGCGKSTLGKTLIRLLQPTEGQIFLDGKEISSDTLKELYDRNGDVKINKENKVSSYDYNSEYREWVQDDTNIISSMHYDGEKRTLVEENASEYLNLFGGFDKFYTEDANEDKRNQKMVNFVELIADTMIGDLKNNIIYVSGDDNSSTYEMNLDAIQIPEVANAGLSAMFSENIANSDDDSDPYILLGTDPIVKNVSVKFTVDNEGRFTNLNAEASMVSNDSNGEKHEATVNITLDMSDYGTTKPERVDISTLPNVEYSDNSGVDTYYGDDE